MGHKKIDLKLTSNYIEHKVKWDGKTKAESEEPKQDFLEKDSE